MLPNVTNRQWKTLSLPQSDMPVQDRGRIKEWRIGGGDGEEDLLRSHVAGFETVETFLEVSEPPTTALPLGLARTSIVWKRF